MTATDPADVTTSPRTMLVTTWEDGTVSVAPDFDASWCDALYAIEQTEAQLRREGARLWVDVAGPTP